MKRLSHFLIKISLLLIANTACAGFFFGQKIIKDTQLSAIEGKDLTALIEGCGNQLIPGYTYCRKTEGDIANDSLSFVGPISNCKRDFCVEFKIYNQSGELVFGSSIDKKQHRKTIPWKTILGRDTFEIDDRGFWIYSYRVYWIDRDGRENVSISEGEIRMRVIRKEYIPLNNVENDSNFTWDIRTKNKETIKLTSSLRAFVSKRGMK